MQLAVLLTHVVKHTGEEVERRVYAELVEESVIALVGLAHLYGVVAHAAAYAEEAETCHGHGYE